MSDVLSQVREERAAAEDRLVQERAAARRALRRRRNRTSPGYVHAVSREGDAVVFVPGEALPSWAIELLDAGKVTRTRKPASWSWRPHRSRRGSEPAG